MQQSSATQSLHLSFLGLRKIVACFHSSSQCLLVSTVFGTVSSLHPTSFLMIFYTCNYYVQRFFPLLWLHTVVRSRINFMGCSTCGIYNVVIHVLPVSRGLKFSDILFFKNRNLEKLANHGNSQISVYFPID